MSSQFNLEESLEKYARLLIRAGCNLKADQELFIASDIANSDLVRKLVKEAYEQGAKDVIVRYTDEVVSKISYDSKPLAAFEIFPDWQALLQNGVAKRGAALLFITAEDPKAFAGVDQKKIATFRKAAHTACKDWRNGIDFGKNVWCIAGAASPAWAKQVFPNLTEAKAIEKLWQAIFTTTRVNTPDPIAAWKAHKNSFTVRKAWLNKQKFDRLHYKNSLGTDITVGLTAASNWRDVGAETVDGTYFFKNIPTEEIYTSPDRNRADGVVFSSMPLNHCGTLIENFSITFKDGRITDYRAEKGYDTLKEIIEIDEGAKHLGEVALVPYNNPIRETGVLFLNTLFDENASCHMAIGRGFPDCYSGGLEMTKEELLAAGINDSVTHVDFMLGTKDLNITGIKSDGTEVAIFRNGDWAF
ncbi:MAG: aminopeptidase [Bdellovibrionota bacterium]|jgi:aminopeptidase